MLDFDVLLLAAGESKRMGQPKQLLPFEGRSFIELSVHKALELQARNLFVVLGAHANAIQQKLQDYQARIVVNEEWKEGMGGSISKGLAHIKNTYGFPAAVMILLCDQPLLFQDKDYLQALLTKWRSNPTSIVATCYGEVFGAPCIVPSLYLDAFLGLKGDKGAKALLNSKKYPTLGLQAGNLSADIDTYEEYLKLVEG